MKRRDVLKLSSLPLLSLTTTPLIATIQPTRLHTTYIMWTDKYEQAMIFKYKDRWVERFISQLSHDIIDDDTPEFLTKRIQMSMEQAYTPWFNGQPALTVDIKTIRIPTTQYNKSIQYMLGEEISNIHIKKKNIQYKALNPYAGNIHHLT